jgi:hypothetical protein
MVAVILLENGEIKGWIIALDIIEAQNKALNAFRSDVAGALHRVYLMEGYPRKGKQEILPGVFLLAQDGDQ